MHRHFFNWVSGSTLSNFYGCQLKLWGREFSSSEQCYQWFKAWFHWKFAIAEEIGRTVDAVKIYRLGKSIVTVRAWQREKVDIMLHILRHKWWQCEQFKRELVAFDQCILTENTKNHFWVLVKLEKG
jgi:predicted NAD-dependent protein-ADP-ribosyltransferase YbiA (DUF1768 family)